MWKPDTIQRRYNEKLDELIMEFEAKLCESLETNYIGIKNKIKEMAKKEENRAGIATVYILRNRNVEFENFINISH